MIQYSKKKLLVSCEQWEILYHKGNLYQCKKNEEKIKRIVKLYPKGLKKILVKFRLAERIFRLEPRTACKINENEFMFSYDGKIILYDLIAQKITNVHHCRGGMNNPLQLIRIEGVRGFRDCIIYGEYWGNEKNEEVCVYSYEDNNWVKKFVFQKGQIQHIHGFVKGEDCVYIMTGDKDECSGIWCATNDFKKVDPVLKGSQKYRACRGFCVSSGLLYATDSPLQENGLYFWDTIDEPRLLCKMPGPCIFATEIEYEKTKIQFFATSVEPDSRYRGLRYLLTYKLGEGVQCRYSYLIAGNIKMGFEVVGKFKKDIWPMGLFQFGNIWFPYNETEKLYLVFQSISKKDGITSEIKVGELNLNR